MKKMFKKKERVIGRNWINLECLEASQKADSFGKQIMNVP